jgi:hypothetical protein
VINDEGQPDAPVSARLRDELRAARGWTVRPAVRRD